MLKKILALTIFVAVSLQGESLFENLFNFEREKPIYFKNLNNAIKSLSTQIFENENSLINKGSMNDKIILTSFVNLNNIKSTSTFGRAVSESLINDLYIKKFKIIDIRAAKNISINQDGEYFLTRKYNELSKKYGSSYTLVGTYSKFESHNVVINIRLLNSQTSEVISTARVIYEYENCEILDLCEENLKASIIKG